MKASPEASAAVLWDLLHASDDPALAFAQLLDAHPELLLDALAVRGLQLRPKLTSSTLVALPWLKVERDRYERLSYWDDEHPVAYVGCYIAQDLNQPFEPQPIWVGRYQSEVCRGLPLSEAQQQVDEVLRGQGYLLL